MNVVRGLLLAIGCATTPLGAGAAAGSTTLGPLSGRVTDAIAAIVNLAVSPAAPGTPLRWALWSDGKPGGVPGDEITRLALFSVSNGVAKTSWSTKWSHAYSPSLTARPEWTFDGRPTIAITMQFGAAAEEVEVWGLDASDHPVKVAAMLIAATGWSMTGTGDPLLVSYERQGSALSPRCYAWRTKPAGLSLVTCPK